MANIHLPGKSTLGRILAAKASPEGPKDWHRITRASRPPHRSSAHLQQSVDGTQEFIGNTGRHAVRL
ncbi:hypothetical protein ACCS96_52570, partial [Rhizobium ruizarguesonis]